MGLANNFDSKIIDNKVEGCGMWDVTKETGSVSGEDVAIVGKVLGEFDVCESAGLGKTVHACANFSKESIVFYERLKIEIHS